MFPSSTVLTQIP